MRSLRTYFLFKLPFKKVVMFRFRCNGTMNNESCNLAKPAFEKFGIPAVKNMMNIKDGDWDCWR